MSEQEDRKRLQALQGIELEALEAIITKLQDCREAEAAYYGEAEGLAADAGLTGNAERILRAAGLMFGLDLVPRRSDDGRGDER